MTQVMVTQLILKEAQHLPLGAAFVLADLAHDDISALSCSSLNKVV